MCNQVSSLKDEISHLNETILHQKDTNNIIIGEISKQNDENFCVLLNIVWGFVNTVSQIGKISNNKEFQQILFDYLETSLEPSILEPVIGILINFNAIDEIRENLGLQTAQIIFKKGVCNDSKICALILKVLMNITFSDVIALNLMKIGIFNYLQDVIKKMGYNNKIIIFTSKILYHLYKACIKKNIYQQYHTTFLEFKRDPFFNKEKNEFAYNILCTICHE